MQTIPWMCPVGFCVSNRNKIILPLNYPEKKRPRIHSRCILGVGFSHILYSIYVVVAHFVHIFFPPARERHGGGGGAGRLKLRRPQCSPCLLHGLPWCRVELNTGRRVLVPSVLIGSLVLILLRAFFIGPFVWIDSCVLFGPVVLIDSSVLIGSLVLIASCIFCWSVRFD